MSLKALQSRAIAIEAELLKLERKPYWRDRWFDSTQGRKAGQHYTRLCWFSSPGKKRRQTLKTSAEIADHRDRVERGKRIKALERELEQVRTAVGRTEKAIAILTE